MYIYGVMCLCIAICSVSTYVISELVLTSVSGCCLAELATRHIYTSGGHCPMLAQVVRTYISHIHHFVNMGVFVPGN